MTRTRMSCLLTLIVGTVVLLSFSRQDAKPTGKAGTTSAAGPAAVQKSSDEKPKMRPAWAIRVATDEVLQLASQMGVRDVVVYGGPGAATLPGTDKPLSKPRADYEDYLALRRRLEAYGLRIAAVEGGFIHLAKYHDVAFGGPQRDALIQELTEEIRDMARAGIPVYGYHWMPALVWRTGWLEIRGGAKATAFDYDRVKQVQDREGCLEAQKALNWALMTCANMPGKGEQPPTEEEMWQQLGYWIRKATPVAEQAGIRLGIHPDDPPVPQLAGVPRILRNHAAYRRLLEIYPSPSNAIEFCQGTFSEMEDDVYEAIRYFGSRQKILYVHFRNVSARVPTFREEFVNTGYVDMPRAMRLYREIGFEGVLIDDHCPDVEGDVEFPGNLGGYRSRVFALGYIQALLDATKPSS
ncbi:MAG: mannonate dehydratase [Acidobacteriota bacterium]